MIDEEKIHKQSLSNDPKERIKALEQLKDNLPLLSNKQQACNDLHRLSNDTDHFVRSSVASTSLSVFQYLPNKQEVWSDLLRLATDKNWYVRHAAAYAFRFAFAYVPDTENAWDSLIELATYNDSYVRFRVIDTLGSVFFYVQNRQKVQEDLIKLSKNNEGDVRAYSHCCLARIYIYRASQAKEEKIYKNELERAIAFYELSAKEETHWSNPSHFCRPFYRSFHTIVFEKKGVKLEVDKYLIEAKDAIEGSKSNEILFKTVEYLANALKDVQNLENLDLKSKKDKLASYREYIDNAVITMADAEIMMPSDIGVLRTGLPILERNLEELIKEIQNKAKITCKESLGTPRQEISCAVNREVQNWGIGNQEEMTSNVSKVVMVLKSKIPHTLENKEILDMIESMKYEKDLTRQYSILPIIIGLIPTVNVVPVEPVLDEIKELRSTVDRLTPSINELQNPQEYLDVILQDLIEIRDYMPKMKGQIENILSELHTPLSTTQKLKIAIPIIPSIVSYEQETDMPEFVAENIHELKNLLHKMKNSLKKLY